MKSLPPGLPDESWIGAVAVEVGADLLPEVLERRGRAGEVDAGEVLVGEGDLGDLRAVARHHVDDPGGMPASSSSSHGEATRRAAGSAGFHTTVLPMSAGAVGRLPAMAVKLNGVIA